MKTRTTPRWLLAAALMAAVPVGLVEATESAFAKDSYVAGDVVEVVVKGTWYPAKVMDVLADGFWVRFDGYNSDYDNVFPEASLRKPKDASTGSKLGALAAAATREATGVSVGSGGARTSTASLPPLSRSGWAPPGAAPAPADPAPAAAPAHSGRATTGGGSTAAAAPAVQATLAIPPFHPQYPDIAFRVGDPVEVIENGKWYRGLITNLNFPARPFTVNMELYEVDRWWPTDEVRTVAGYDYAKLPSTSSIGTEGAWKEGDQIQAQYRWSVNNYWGDGVVVSVDGDNYYVYLPEGTGTTGQNYMWRHSDRVRNPGGTKTGWDEAADPSGQRAAYLSAVSAAGCADPGGKNATASFPFLWYYDHSFDRQVYGVTVYQIPEDSVTAAFEAYKCLGPVAAKYTNLPSDGVPYDDAIPTNVQAGFLANASSIMKKAMVEDVKHALLAMVIYEGTYTPGGPATNLAYKDGLDRVKRKIQDDGGVTKMAGSLSLVGETIAYPWDVLEARWGPAQQGLIDYAAAQSPSIESIEGYTTSFTFTDAKVEGLAKTAALKAHPGGTVLASHTDSAALVVIKDDYGVPTYRYKYIGMLIKDPAMITCAKVAYRYREDYAGNGSYSAGFVDRFGAYSMGSVDDYVKCP